MLLKMENYAPRIACRYAPPLMRLDRSMHEVDGFELRQQSSFDERFDTFGRACSWGSATKLASNPRCFLTTVHSDFRSCFARKNANSRSQRERIGFSRQGAEILNAHALAMESKAVPGFPATRNRR
ncbi:hypothetical protein [Burkholderia sp. BCC1970]|uniref:hypothetical protein n=1 Tax=Burkholderia sp. BCC1970 TaxID=2817437 RepID=UPI002ABE5B0B|nr:hypothetical protein [Burkholderia sp. BCC1970]